jgi:hypothetical protein
MRTEATRLDVEARKIFLELGVSNSSCDVQSLISGHEGDHLCTVRRSTRVHALAPPLTGFSWPPTAAVAALVVPSPRGAVVAQILVLRLTNSSVRRFVASLPASAVPQQAGSSDRGHRVQHGDAHRQDRFCAVPADRGLRQRVLQPHVPHAGPGRHALPVLSRPGDRRRRGTSGRGCECFVVPSLLCAVRPPLFTQRCLRVVLPATPTHRLCCARMRAFLRADRPPVQADFPNYKTLCCQVQDVLLDMAYDLGQVRVCGVVVTLRSTSLPSAVCRTNSWRASISRLLFRAYGTGCQLGGSACCFVMAVCNVPFVSFLVPILFLSSRPASPRSRPSRPPSPPRTTSPPPPPSTRRRGAPSCPTAAPTTAL